MRAALRGAGACGAIACEVGAGAGCANVLEQRQKSKASRVMSQDYRGNREKEAEPWRVFSHSRGERVQTYPRRVTAMSSATVLGGRGSPRRAARAMLWSDGWGEGAGRFLPRSWQSAATAASGVEALSKAGVVLVEYEVGGDIEPVARIGGRAGRIFAAGLGEGETADETVGPFLLGALRSGMGKARYCEAVARGVEYIRAGDVFQVNLAHPLEAAFRGDARSLARELFARSGPRYGAYLEWEEGDEKFAAISLSPELFFTFDSTTRRIVTRPMKGTRPGTADATELRDSPKDRAELDMIIDLMRNDLGRMCEIGSVKVEARREIERHAAGGVWQAVGQVAGVAREGTGIAEIMRAMFPAGSVTGAPKIRAMQIIGELEDRPRGPYCGSIGVIGSDGSATFNVAIRTAFIRGTGKLPGLFDDGVVEYWVGAGIVADSRPELEWQETLHKASIWSGLTTIEEPW